MPKRSRQDGNVSNAGHAKHAAITLGFDGIAHGLGVVVRELDCRPAVNFAELANQADGIETVVDFGDCNRESHW